LQKRKGEKNPHVKAWGEGEVPGELWGTWWRGGKAKEEERSWKNKIKESGWETKGGPKKRKSILSEGN